MRIGVDFDNTIACYDGVFHAIALERGLIPADLATDKTSVRDYLRGKGQDAVFTELQGYAYGPGMVHARVYTGATAALRVLAAAGHSICLISHKTRTPFAGPAYDLHDWAWQFLRRQGLVEAPDAPFTADGIYFELTKEAKLARIGAQGCDWFIDDLPEILTAPQFPIATRRLLFDPEGRYPQGFGQERQLICCASWAEMPGLLA